MNLFSSRQIPVLDIWLLSFFIVFITFPLFIFQGPLNLFELGIYLPAIDGILQGKVPYRDFFYLRGPLDLYLPALAMEVFGRKVFVLNAYFYLGTVLTLLAFLFVARRILPNRWILWLFVLVFVARTFPRVVFTYWGGLRFAWGILAVLCIFMFIEKKQKRWLVLAGILASLALLTSLDVGICTIAVLAAVLLFDKNIKEGLSYFSCCLSGVFLVLGPYLIYLASQNALAVFWEAQLVVATQMQMVFNTQDQGLAFKHLTPWGLYGLCAAWLFYRRKNKDDVWKKVLVLFVYGLFMYVLSFRNIQAAQFEMALQPEKILLFFFLAWAGCLLWEKTQRRRFVIYLFTFIVFASSLGYAFQRYHHRFPAFQVMIGKDIKRFEGRPVSVYALEGLILPEEQAKEFEAVHHFVRNNVGIKEKVVFYDELGVYHFLISRDFAGQFPMAVFSWLDDNWHQEYMQTLARVSVDYIFVDRDKPDWFEGVYFKHVPNREKFDEFYRFLEGAYEKRGSLGGIDIYQKKSAL